MFSTQYDDQGREIPDPRRMALPAGWDRPLSLADQIKRMVRTELSRQAVETGQESFEEADDFDVDDGETEFLSPYEVVEMPLDGPTSPDPDGPATSPPAKASEAPTGVSEAPVEAAK